jgi:single-strand DNA-binding protein
VANLNRVLLIGNMTRDPQLRYTPSNAAVCEFGIAVNRKWTDKAGQKQEEVTFIDCTAWAKTGELINEHLRKGSPIFIEGRLKLDQWEDKQGGGKRSKLSVVVENFQFIGGKGDGEQPQGREKFTKPDKPQGSPIEDDAGLDVPF